MRTILAILGMVFCLLSARGADFPSTVTAEALSGRLLAPAHFFDTNVQAGSNIAIQHFASGKIVIDGTAAPVNVSHLQFGSTVLTNLANLGVTNFQAGAGIAVAIVNGTLWVTNLWSTNGFVTATITNGLATVSFVQNATNGFVGIQITNGLASILYVQAITNGFVGPEITNGFATISYVQNATNGFVGPAITNNLASIAYVQASDITTSNALLALMISYDATGSNALRTLLLNNDIITSNGVVNLLTNNYVKVINGGSDGQNATNLLVWSFQASPADNLYHLAWSGGGTTGDIPVLGVADAQTSRDFGYDSGSFWYDVGPEILHTPNVTAHEMLTDDLTANANVRAATFLMDDGGAILATGGGSSGIIDIGGSGSVGVIRIWDGVLGHYLQYDSELSDSTGVLNISAGTDFQTLGGFTAAGGMHCAEVATFAAGMKLSSVGQGGRLASYVSIGGAPYLTNTPYSEIQVGYAITNAITLISTQGVALTVTGLNFGNGMTGVVASGQLNLGVSSSSLDFNPNQFAVSGSSVSLTNGVKATNAALYNPTLPTATASRAMVLDANKVPTNSVVTSTELALLSGQTTLAYQPTNDVLTKLAGNAGNTVTNWSPDQFSVAAGTIALTNNAKATNLDLYLGVTVETATASRAAVFDANKRLTNSTVTATELGYVAGATSSLQTQINSINANLLTNGSMLKTNFILNTAYTNANAGPIFIRATSYLIPALVNGTASLDLMAAYGGGSYSLLARSAMATLLTGGIALPITNDITAVLTNLASYYFTNTSSGAGDSSGIVAGSGQVTVIGGAIPPVPGIWMGGAGGNIATTANIYKYAQVSGQNQLVAGSTNTGVNQWPIQNFTCTGMAFNTATLTLGTGTNITVAFQTNGVDAFTATLTGNGSRKVCFAFAQSIPVTTNDNFNIRWVCDGNVQAQNYSSSVSFTIP